ncbi:SMI1/KNR4 family protein [Thalassobius sp. I31.1]|uniref:SMI1/KNR4 family protein n=1 Tax=Thalassobius sp. I31.1 TaxID=2109912 RepID=UPI000D1A1C9C|nr:SMI1/KNR4 family protein [Thalassobius sp. I31.1]
MEFRDISWTGGAVDNLPLLAKLPEELRDLLKQKNGFIQFGGGLHVRGICQELEWHSLEEAWTGQTAFHTAYEVVRAEWIPFAQDCVGDQFFLADGEVIRLLAESGDIELTGLGLMAFLHEAAQDPVEFLALQPLLRLQAESGNLEPGNLIHVWPPYCTREAAEGVSLRAVSAVELHCFHKSFAAVLPEDGQQVEVKVGP